MSKKNKLLLLGFILMIWSCEQENPLSKENHTQGNFDDATIRSLAAYNLKPSDFASENNAARLAYVKQKKIIIGNEEIAYFETSGKGADILLIHGNSQSSSSFSRQLNSVLASTFHIISIDLPGHGLSKNSPDPAVTYQLPGYAELLKQIVDKLNMEKAVIVGWSLGASILVEAVDRLPNVPGVMLLGATPLDHPFNPAALLPSDVAELLFKPDPFTEEEIALAKPFLFRPGVHSIPGFVEADARRQDPMVRLYLGVSVFTENYKNQLAILKNLDIPIAVLNGAQERVVNVAYQRSLSMPTLWHNKIWLIPNAGHIAQWENPLYFNVLLAAFVIDVNLN